MTRTLATISTEKGIAAIQHDDETSELTAVFADGTTETPGDYYPTKSWRNARKQIIAWYGCSMGETRSYHDTWVLCLRPLRSLEIVRSEENQGVLVA